MPLYCETLTTLSQKICMRLKIHLTKDSDFKQTHVKKKQSGIIFRWINKLYLKCIIVIFQTS